MDKAPSPPDATAERKPPQQSSGSFRAAMKKSSTAIFVKPAPREDAFLPEAVEAVTLDYLSRRRDVSSRDILLDVMRKKMQHSHDCMSLPISILFFMVYSSSILLHEDITNVFLLESAVLNSLEPGLQNLTTISGVYNWLETDFVNTFFVQEDLYGEPLPQDLWSRVLVYSQVQGAVILEQTRSTGDPWGQELEPPLDNFTAGLQEQNYGFDAATDTASVFSGGFRRLDVMRPEVQPWISGSASNGVATYRIDLPSYSPASEIQATLQYLEQRDWLDEDSMSLDLKAVLLNSELGRPRIEQLRTEIHFSRGGSIFYKNTMQSLFLEAWPPNPLCILMDFMFVVMLIVNSCVIIRSLFKAAMVQKTIQHVTDFSVILEWVITVWGWVNLAGFFAIYVALMPGVRDELVKMHNDPNRGSTKLHDLTLECIWLTGRYRLFWSWYTLVLMMRFFLAFRAHPRLAVVTRTLKAVSVDLLHFALVFFPCFSAYVISGNILFGRRLEEFATIQASAATCFRIVVENEYEWEDLAEDHFLTSALWVWTFLVVVVIIMFNMVLAIILDIYNEVRQTVDSSDTVFLFLRNLASRTMNRRKWVRMHTLDKLFAGIDGNATITKEDVREICPDLKDFQVDQMFKASQDHTAFTLQNHMNTAAVLKMSATIKLGLEKTSKMILELDGSTGYASLASQADRPRTPTKKKTLSRSGGDHAPLLEPDAASNEVPDPVGRPEWLQELDEQLDMQDRWLTSVQARLQKLQWTWHQEHRQAIASGKAEGAQSNLPTLSTREGIESAKDHPF